MLSKQDVQIFRPFRSLKPEVTFALSFSSIILLGATLLVLPISSVNERASFIDALFTAASATCVTGLAVVDTGTYWSLFGQIVILLLIQVGGLGIMTFSTFFVYLFARRLSIWNREMLESSFAGAGKGQLAHLLLTIILSTLTLEAIGACFLALRFASVLPIGKALYFAVFHSVSAFCNAGFSLFSNNLVDFQGDIMVNLTIISLIILGGIGFWVLFDLKNIIRKKRNIHSTSLHTRIVLLMTALLIISGFAIILIGEWQHCLKGLPIKNKLLAALFQSVTPRTAGFNTIDISVLSNSSIFIIIFLMFIGASPGSTGGGIKTSTFAIMLATITAHLHNQRQVQIFKRGIPDLVISKAISITFFVMVTLIIFCFTLLLTEQQITAEVHQHTVFIEIIFEAVSAIGTVGLSLGITPDLSSTGKVLITFLMFIGRIGATTLMLAIIGNKNTKIKFAEDNVWVG